MEWFLVHTRVRIPMVHFPGKWRGRISIPVHHIAIGINPELCWVKPCIPANVFSPLAFLINV
jgi:hypothetical protein